MESNYVCDVLSHGEGAVYGEVGGVSGRKSDFQGVILINDALASFLVSGLGPGGHDSVRDSEGSG